MNILVHANHFIVCSGRYYTDAFRRAGHDVRTIGSAKGRHIWGMALPEALAWQPEPPDEDWTPDLIVYADSDPAILDIVLEGAPRIVVGVDNHCRDYRRPYFDHYFLAHRNVSQMAWQPDDPRISPDWQPQWADMTHLPCAYDPTIHTPSPIPWHEREYDVCMLGFPYPQRVQQVAELRAAGFRVLAGLGYIDEAYRDAYHNSRISLCQSVAGDVAQRLFETAALGCVVMTDRCADFPIVQPVGLWEIEDRPLADQVRDILADPDAPAQALVGLRWAQQHTWDARVKVIEAWYENDTHYTPAVG